MFDGCVNCIFFLQISVKKICCTKYSLELDEERVKRGCISFSLELTDEDADIFMKDFDKNKSCL